MKTCSHCAAEHSRARADYCSAPCKNRAAAAKRKAEGKHYPEALEPRTCWCGRPFAAKRSHDTEHCSKRCSQQTRFGVCRLPSDHPVRRIISAMNATAYSALGPLRQALIDGDTTRVIATLRADTVVTTQGCWEWTRGTDSSGYGRVVVGPRGKGAGVHRVMAEAVYGPLGIEPVHHKCANILCVNPEHLQPISHRENAAEMMQRTYYVARIAELESALGDIAPNHPKLLGRTA